MHFQFGQLSDRNVKLAFLLPENLSKKLIPQNVLQSYKSLVCQKNHNAEEGKRSQLHISNA